MVVRFKLDSGATCNVMPLEVYQRVTALDRLDPEFVIMVHVGVISKFWVHSQDLWLVVVSSLQLN